MQNSRITLVLGGARSGKSRHAESLATQGGHKVVYIATAEALDEEMAARISLHRQDRPKEWRTVEEPRDLSGCIENQNASDVCLLVDCLTIWLSNLMGDGVDPREAVRALVAALKQSQGETILVSNEVGLGIVPDNPIARRFRDEAGWMHQALADIADTVVFVAAGLPITLKDNAHA